MSRWDFTLTAYAAEISRLTGANVVSTEMLADALEHALAADGLPLQMAAVMADCDDAIARGDLAEASGELARLIGRPVTPWRETLAAAVRALG